MLNNNDFNTKENQIKLIGAVENICKNLKTVMEVNEYRNYVLGFLSYKYLSEQIEKEVEKHLEIQNIKYKNFNSKLEKYDHIKNFIIEDSLGFYIDYEYSFSNVVDLINQDKDIIPIIEKAFYKIEESSIGKKSEDVFRGLFGDVKLDDSKLGKIKEQREKTVKFIVKEFSSLKLSFDGIENDAFGSVYKDLLLKFANDAGKKAQELYTPTSVAELITKIATYNRKSFNSAYDPACGSGYLLIKLTKKVKGHFDKVYGQEVKASTFNLARINLLLMGMKHFDFNIKEGDTLISPKHLGLEFDCIVSNPPFGLKWNPSPILKRDERYSPYGKLAPKSCADFAFLQHMLYYVKKDGGIIVSVSSVGVLDRNIKDEKNIRQYIIDHNYIDSVILLPSKIFSNTTIEACIIVARKDKKNDNVFFINGSAELQVGKKQNKLSEENIAKIFNAWKNKSEIENFSKFVSKSVIVKNDYSLSVSTYIKLKDKDTEVVDIDQVNKELADIDSKIQELKNKFEENLKIYKEKYSKDS